MDPQENMEPMDPAGEATSPDAETETETATVYGGPEVKLLVDLDRELFCLAVEDEEGPDLCLMDEDVSVVSYGGCVYQAQCSKDYDGEPDATDPDNLVDYAITVDGVEFDGPVTLEFVDFGDDEDEDEGEDEDEDLSGDDADDGDDEDDEDDEENGTKEDQ